LGELFRWGRALYHGEISLAQHKDEASSLIAGILRNRKMLLLVDDVWEPSQGRLFQVGGENCAVLFSSRKDIVVSQLAETPDNIFTLGKITLSYALELLSKLAPNIVRDFPKECTLMLEELDGLPLTIQIAGRLLQTDYSYGLPVLERIGEIRSGQLLNQSAPVDRMLEDGVTPTLLSILKTSTDALDPFARDCFACLGELAPKPARFTMKTLAIIWEVEDPREIISKLIGHGLMEKLDDGTYQLHALLVWHAKAMRKRKKH
jgi:hypothetical protein